MTISPLVRRYMNRHSLAYQVPIANTDIFKCSFTHPDHYGFESLPDFLICSAEGAEDGVAKFTSLVGALSSLL